MVKELFELQIISPDRIFYNGEASMIELTTTEGEMGIYKGHIPMTCILAPGVITIHEANGTKKAAIHQGFIQILPEAITIMAEVAEWGDEIDLERAKRAKERAEERLKGDRTKIDVKRAELALHRAVARIELVRKV